MRYFSVIVALVIASVAAGCTNEEESSERSRGFSVNVPSDVQRLQVEVTARSAQNSRVQIEIEREDGTDIAEDNIELSGGTGTKTVEAEVTGLGTVYVLVTVAEGDATVDVTVRGERAEGEPIVIRQETLVIVVSPPPASTTPADDGGNTPTPATGATPAPTATPTATPSATPSPTSETNTTPTDNSTNTTANETNATP